MPTVPFKSYPLADRGMSWSFTAADGNALINSGGWPLYKSVHTWFEGSGTPEVRSAYKMPHHKKVGDSVKTVWRGVVAAMSRMMQANTQIPDADRRGCYNHLSRHYREFDEEPPEFGAYTDTELAYMLADYGFTEDEIKEVLEPQTFAARQFGKPTASQLESINSMLPRGAKPLSAEEVFTFNAKIIGDGLIPDRFFRMMRSALVNIRDDAKQGVSFLLDHSWSGIAPPKAAIPYGKTFDAVLRKLAADEVVGDETQAVFADHYIPRGMEMDGISTDGIIRQIETGILSDTSIGWYGGKLLCSICGNNYLDYSVCPHFAGREYEGQICEVQVHSPVGLMENSGVFDGAYPGAGILAAGGQYQPGDLVVVEDLKRVGDPTTRVFGTYSAKSGATLYVPKGTVLNKTLITVNQGKEERSLENTKELQSKIDELTAQLADKDTKLSAAEATIAELQGKVETLDAETKRLQPLARDGEAYKVFMIDETHKWGVRAMGNTYNKELHDKIFVGLTIDEVKGFKDQFEAKAREEIAAGRVSKVGQPNPDHSLRGNGGVPNPATDEKAYRAKVAEVAARLKAEGKAKTIKEATKMAHFELRKEVN